MLKKELRENQSAMFVYHFSFVENVAEKKPQHSNPAAKDPANHFLSRILLILQICTIPFISFPTY